MSVGYGTTVPDGYKLVGTDPVPSDAVFFIHTGVTLPTSGSYGKVTNTGLSYRKSNGTIRENCYIQITTGNHGTAGQYSHMVITITNGTNYYDLTYGTAMYAGKTLWNNGIGDFDNDLISDGTFCFTSSSYTNNWLYYKRNRQLVPLYDGDELQDSATFTPTTSQQTLTLDDGKVAVKAVTVNAVTSSIDANIQSSNIKAGVTILGVEGNLTTDKPDQIKTATPTEEQQVITPDEGYELSSVTVEPIPENYIVPAGTHTITENIEEFDISQYAAVTVNVDHITTLGYAEVAEENGEAYSLSYQFMTGDIDAYAGSYEITQNGVIHCAGKNMASDIIIKVTTDTSIATSDEDMETADAGSVIEYTGEESDTYEAGRMYYVQSMIDFTIDDVAYEAEENMTWADWCESEYNIIGYYAHDDNTVGDDANYINDVVSTNTIIDGTDYIISAYGNV